MLSFRIGGGSLDVREIVVLAFLLCALAGYASAQEYGIYHPYVEVKVRSPYLRLHEAETAESKEYDWSVSNGRAHETDVTVFFTAVFAFEWGLAKSDHEFSLDPHSGKSSPLGSMSLRTETFMFQVHYPTENRIKPYVGVGTSRIKLNGSIAPSYPDPHYGLQFSGNGYKWGWVAQGGVDFLMRWNIVINVDFKYIWNDILIKGLTISPGPFHGKAYPYDIQINPALFGLGVGFRW